MAVEKTLGMSRREWLEKTAKGAALTVVLAPIAGGEAQAVLMAVPPLNGVAGPDRIAIMPGKTYLRGWAGYGDPPRPRRRARNEPAPPPEEPAGPPPTVTWTSQSGPGTVTFADAKATVTTAVFSEPGVYVLKLTVDNGQTTAASTLTVDVQQPPPATPLQPVTTVPYRVDGPLWRERLRAVIVNWIPHCIDQINRTDLVQGPGGIDNFIEAAKALKGEPHGPHKGYVFSNAWVHQTVEAMSLALMVDAQGDKAILEAQSRMRATLEDWIPKVLAAQHPDGYLQTAFTLRNRERWADRWTAQGRGNHEGYVAGYFIESAINHYVMTGRKDARLYEAAKKLADCWCEHLGPAPKQAWFDGHQEMEQALVRFGRFVNEVEGGNGGQRYIDLAKFLLDCRANGTEYDQSHLPVVEQYEAMGHAVRAVYTYSAMADVAMETRDPDYLSAAFSIWDNIVNRKYYVTGGVGSGETSEGFGPDYSLRNNAYCESCSSCGEIFFQWKMNLISHDARCADLCEQTLYNALLGSLDLDAKNFYYDNPLDANVPRYPWHGCPCCVGNIPRTLLMLPTWTYAKDETSLYVNLFTAGRMSVGTVAGTEVEVVQATNYPWDGRVRITINPKAPRRFALKVRMPTRDVSRLYTASPAADGIVSIAVNGAPVRVAAEKGYAVVARTWRDGDRVELTLPLRAQRVHASAKIAATKGRVALRYGPLVYNIEKADQDLSKALGPASALTPEWRPDLLGGVTVIKGTFADLSPMVAIPNFVRYNRGPAPAPRPPKPADPAAPRPAPPPPASIVWIIEG